MAPDGGKVVKELFVLTGSWAAGMVLGLWFFGGLKITVERLPSVRRPELLAIGSFVVRTGATLFGFYTVMGGQWERLVACVVGFLLMRKLLVWRWQPRGTRLPIR